MILVFFIKLDFVLKFFLLDFALSYLKWIAYLFIVYKIPWLNNLLLSLRTDFITFDHTDDVEQLINNFSNNNSAHKWVCLFTEGAKWTQNTDTNVHGKRTGENGTASMKELSHYLLTKYCCTNIPSLLAINCQH